MGAREMLARVFSPRQKINPAGEGNYHAGPYHIMGANGGWLPHEWGQFWNFWQMDYDPLPYPSCSVVEACVWAYIRAVAQLPGYHKRELANGGTEIINTSALSRLLRAPNFYQTPSDFLVHLIRSLLLAGNSYWIAQRNERSEVTALHWTNPRQCRVREIGVEGELFKEVFYEIGDNPLLDPRRFNIENMVVPARDVLHIKLATPRHPLVGETWLAALSHELAQRAAINRSSATISSNMSRPSGVLQTDLTMTKAQVDELRERWNTQAAGMNAGGVPILTSGLKFEKVSMSNADQQVIEQLKMNDRTIAAVFGVPSMLLGLEEGGTAKNAEAMMSEWLASGLGWLINHVEVSLDAFVGLNNVAAGREWTEFDTRALLRSLFKDRMDGLVRGVQGGIYSPNEARALEGYGAAKAGDEPRVQQQVVPLSFAAEPPKPPPAPAPPAPDDDDDEPDDDAPDDDDETERAVAFQRLRTMVSNYARS